MVRALGAVCMAAAAAWGTGVTDRPVVLAQAPQAAAAQIVEAEQASRLEEFAPGVPRKGTPGLVLPKLQESSQPKYTPAALRAKIAGTVVIHAIVGVDGLIEKSAVWRSLDTGLDSQALKALSEWTFEPGRLNGAPIRVAIEVRMEFNLR